MKQNVSMLVRTCSSWRTWVCWWSLYWSRLTKEVLLV